MYLKIYLSTSYIICKNLSLISWLLYMYICSWDKQSEVVFHPLLLTFFLATGDCTSNPIIKIFHVIYDNGPSLLKFSITNVSLNCPYILFCCCSVCFSCGHQAPFCFDEDGPPQANVRANECILCGSDGGKRMTPLESFK